MQTTLEKMHRPEKWNPSFLAMDGTRLPWAERKHPG
jgi:hypothetical protein